MPYHLDLRGSPRPERGDRAKVKEGAEVLVQEGSTDQPMFERSVSALKGLVECLANGANYDTNLDDGIGANMHCR